MTFGNESTEEVAHAPLDRFLEQGAFEGCRSTPSTSTRHTPGTRLTPLEETLRFFDDAVTVGKIRYAGVSNFLGWQLQKAAMLTSVLGLTPIVTLQP